MSIVILMKNGIIFDLDGTLWDSSERVVESWNEVLVSFGEKKHITLEELQTKIMGKQMDYIARYVLPNVDEEYRKKVFDKCMEKEHQLLSKKGGILYPNLENTLKKLAKRYKLFIVSNCQEGYIEVFLEYHKLKKYFTDIECFGATKMSKGANIKLIIERNKLEKAVYVGDTIGDYEASVEAKVPFIYAEYGFGNVNKDVHKIEGIAQLEDKIDSIIN